MLPLLSPLSLSVSHYLSFHVQPNQSLPHIFMPHWLTEHVVSLWKYSQINPPPLPPPSPLFPPPSILRQHVHIITSVSTHKQLFCSPLSPHALSLSRSHTLTLVLSWDAVGHSSANRHRRQYCWRGGCHHRGHRWHGFCLPTSSNSSSVESLAKHKAFNIASHVAFPGPVLISICLPLTPLPPPRAHSRD